VCVSLYPTIRACACVSARELAQPVYRGPVYLSVYLWCVRPCICPRALPSVWQASVLLSWAIGQNARRPATVLLSSPFGTCFQCQPLRIFGTNLAVDRWWLKLGWVRLPVLTCRHGCILHKGWLDRHDCRGLQALFMRWQNV
jgi:hypothetical protein